MKKVNVKMSARGEKNLIFKFEDDLTDKEVSDQVLSIIRHIDVETEITYDISVEQYNEEEQGFYND